MKDKIVNYINNKEYQEFKRAILDISEVDIAEILSELELEPLIKSFRLLPKDIAADVFAYLPLDIEQKIITSLSDKEGASIIDNMFADDATDLIDEMPANVVRKLLKNTTPETRRDINYLLKYPDNSAGSVMTVEFVDLKEDNTVKKAINKIRQKSSELEYFDFCYVLDQYRKLNGIVSLKDLVLAHENEFISTIMKNDVISVNTFTDQEEVAKLFKKYDINTMPVCDSENRLVGIITIDDVVDIIEEETTEDIEKMAAITPNDKSYMKTSVFETWKKRIPWLLLLMISATFTGKIIRNYEASLAACVVLTSFIPMIMDTGGNAGGQSSVTIIRSLSLNEIDNKDILKVVWKELRVSILVGLTLGGANFLKLLFIDKVEIKVAIVVCSTLLLTVVVAKLVGSSLPIVAKKIGFDPAVMASPFITTIVDAISLILYFTIASSLLNI